MVRKQRTPEFLRHNYHKVFVLRLNNLKTAIMALPLQLGDTRRMLPSDCNASIKTRRDCTLSCDCSISFKKKCFRERYMHLLVFNCIRVIWYISLKMSVNRLIPCKKVHHFNELVHTYLEHLVFSVNQRKSYKIFWIKSWIQYSYPYNLILVATSFLIGYTYSSLSYNITSP